MYWGVGKWVDVCIEGKMSYRPPQGFLTLSNRIVEENIER